MKHHKWKLRLTVLILYAVTWAGGWMTHARNMNDSAWEKYRLQQAYNAECMARAPAGTEVPFPAQLREGGPKTGVKWCLPVLPGVLLADSYEILGPLNERGMVKIVFYYGVDSVIVCELWGWLT
jgi:hypothetical protein